jgi:hypothetical protein
MDFDRLIWEKSPNSVVQSRKGDKKWCKEYDIIDLKLNIFMGSIKEKLTLCSASNITIIIRINNDNNSNNNMVTLTGSNP